MIEATRREEMLASQTFRSYQPDRMLLIPVALQEWLPSDHPAYFISDLVGQLDLREAPSLPKGSPRTGWGPTYEGSPILLERRLP